MSDNKITQDQLEPNVMEELESGIGDLSTLSTENKDSLVAAVTEIYGKNVIAEAIGEPLAVTDTFSEMGNEINSLLSSFKVNMMNSGVVVESSDKFKALIDKIKGLTEGEGNTGVQFAEISLNENFSSASGTTSKTFTFEDIGFLPSLYFLHITNIDEDVVNICVPNGFTTDCLNQVVIVRLTDITTSSLTAQFTIDSYDTDYVFTLSGLKLIAIGVGEEDTTLRDSLASILEDKGVNVTEEDDMASLIGKVDSEFVGSSSNVKSGVLIDASTSYNEWQEVVVNVSGLSTKIKEVNCLYITEDDISNSFVDTHTTLISSLLHYSENTAVSCNAYDTTVFFYIDNLTTTSFTVHYKSNDYGSVSSIHWIATT